VEPDTAMSKAEQRKTNRAMIARLRANPVRQYEDRDPVPRVIDVVGRRSGEPRPFPVNVTSVDGRLYVCSSSRTRDWVRNLLARRRCRVERDGRGGADTERRPVLATPSEAAAVLAIYLPRAGYRDPLLPFEPDAPVEEIERHVHALAVIRLDPATP
jgi:deazaflavin-dependent oxidoreductase (nitroreductase family)